ncbi:hypothetical protein VTN00DRAFT_8451 [Thermoascus crustaceus]|uniref:uncharacterized protein n=1 Tax=Thermoascus crustaceus TaxID=5088 RepID=UPI0037443D3A
MRGVKKSRNGCARCKSKRLKCDEEKPACGRCTRLGVKCPGYVQSLRWITKHEVLDNIQQQHSPDNAGKRNSPPKQEESMDLASGAPLVFNDILNTQPQASASQLEADPHFMHEPSLSSDDPWDIQLGDPFGDPLGPLALEFSSLPQVADATFGCEQTVNGPTETSPQDIRRRSSSVSTGFVNPDSISAYSAFLPSPVMRNCSLGRSNPSSGPSLEGSLNVFMPLQRSLNDPSSTLIEYYFKEVAGLFSSYDGQMNPFRSTVSRLWGSSLAMCKTLQSMAAATLVDDFPQFGPIGLKMRREAIDILKKDAVMDDKSLLALLMLGQTASWHNPNDLGISFFNLLRRRLNSMSSNSQRLGSANNYQFFEEALIYWEMLLSYVADGDALVSTGAPASQMADSIVLQRVPHPWTGIARDTQFTVHEVGRLIRRERNRVRTRRFTSQGDILQAQKAIERAGELEEKLLSLAHPAEAEVVSPGDYDTPVWHLLTMAEVYRCTGLIQLYRVFPDLLRRRVASRNVSRSDQPPEADNQSPLSQVEIANIFDSLVGTTSEDGNGSANANANESEVDDESLFESLRDNSLTTFALTTMSRLKTIPIESRTRCLQPFLLVACSSELRLPPPCPPDESGSGDLNLNISSHAIEVSRTRRFILGRLSSFLHVLPPKPIRVCLQLVQEVWSRMDAGEQNVYWMDVMIENGWETTMG